ncbi:hypothetical protein CIHG_02600, partial [Coccidioides immitis H538.4]
PGPDSVGILTEEPAPVHATPKESGIRDAGNERSNDDGTGDGQMRFGEINGIGYELFSRLGFVHDKGRLDPPRWADSQAANDEEDDIHPGQSFHAIRLMETMPNVIEGESHARETSGHDEVRITLPQYAAWLVRLTVPPVICLHVRIPRK